MNGRRATNEGHVSRFVLYKRVKVCLHVTFLRCRELQRGSEWGGGRGKAIDFTSPRSSSGQASQPYEMVPIGTISSPSEGGRKPQGENHHVLAVKGERHLTYSPESELNPVRSGERQTCYHGATKESRRGCLEQRSWYSSGWKENAIHAYYVADGNYKNWYRTHSGTIPAVQFKRITINHAIVIVQLIEGVNTS